MYPDTIGSGLAVCLLTLFYAIFIYLPIRERFRRTPEHEA